jgi:MFS family permease
LGSRLDALGSRPVLCFALFVWVLVMVGWVGLAGELLRPALVIVLGLQFLMGLFAALTTMANLRLAMAVIPEMGRDHFFALYTVLSSVALGLAPIGWGMLIDATGPWQSTWLGVVWNRYTIFFATSILVFLAALILARRLEEPQAASMEQLLREILVQSPQRLWIRLWPRG